MRKKDGLQPASLRGGGRRGSESMIVPEKEHDSGCNRFSSHLPWGDLPVGEGLFTNDRRERRGGGLQRLIICCEPSSPWFLALRSYDNNKSFFNTRACLCLCLGFEAIHQKWRHVKAVTTFMVMAEVPLGTIPFFLTYNVPSYYSPTKKRRY